MSVKHRVRFLRQRSFMRATCGIKWYMIVPRRRPQVNATKPRHTHKQYRPEKRQTPDLTFSSRLSFMDASLFEVCHEALSSMIYILSKWIILAHSRRTRPSSHTRKCRSFTWKIRWLLFTIYKCATLVWKWLSDTARILNWIEQSG